MINKKDLTCAIQVMSIQINIVQNVEFVFLNMDYLTMVPSKEFNIDRFVKVFIDVCNEHQNVKHIISTYYTLNGLHLVLQQIMKMWKRRKLINFPSFIIS